MRRILVFTRQYIPGFKGGGPLRSLSALVEHLGNEFEFYVVTQDRDLGDLESYKCIQLGTWNSVSGAQVKYFPLESISFNEIIGIFKDVGPDAIYLNSFFDPIFTLRVLVVRKIFRFFDRNLILAPRGELTYGALGIKKFKKNLFIKLAKFIGLYEGVIWHVSSDIEKDCVLRVFGSSVARNVLVAPNLAPSLSQQVDSLDRRHGGALRICFLSRISRMKNLDYALRVLREVKADVIFNIYGPVEDDVYMKECNDLIGELPENVRVKLCGSVDPERVLDLLSCNDLFFFPTRGENFGHVIREALTAGLLVLTSDQTPWQDLEEFQVGWSIPLSRETEFARLIEGVAGFSEHAKESAVRRCKEYARKRINSQEVIEANRHLFGFACQS